MEKGIQELLLDAGLIYGAQTENFNDAERVGQMFIDIIEYIKNHESAWSSGGSGPSPITGYGELLTDLWNFNNPDANNKILIYNNGWDYGPLPEGGGPGGGLDVAAMWGELTSNEPSSTYYNTLINKGHLDLSDCLKTNATFWGNPVNTSNPNLHTVTGSLSGGIEYIEFSNGVRIYAEEGNYTLKVYAPNNTGQVGHIYATGGVSALGYSSSGGGDTPTPGGTSLDSGILKHVNSYTLSSITESTTPNIGDIITWSSSGGSYRWMYMPNTLDNLKNVTITDPANGEVLMYRKQGTSGYWYNGTVETMTSVELSNVGGVTLASGVSNYPIILGKAKAGDFTNIPLSNLIVAGEGIIIDSETVSNNTRLKIYSDVATSGNLGGIQVGYSQNNKNYPVTLDDNNNAYVNVPWTDNDHIYLNGDGLNLNSSTGVFSVKPASGGGLTVGSDGVKIDPNTSKRVLWGNQDTLLNDIGKEGARRNLQYVGDILMKDEVYMSFDSSTANENEYAMLTLNSQGLHIGMGYNSESGGSSLSNFPIILEQLTYVRNSGNTPSTTGLRIGNAILYWEEDKQALALAKYNDSNPSSPTAANFYATGGVSALGMSSGSGSVGAMTFENLSITDALSFDDNDDAYIQYNSETETLKIYSVGYLDLDSAFIKLKVGDDGSVIREISYSSVDNYMSFVIGNKRYKFRPDVTETEN